MLPPADPIHIPYAWPSGPDLEGEGSRGPGPRPPTIEGPPTELLTFYFLLMIPLMTFFIDVLLQFASVTMY